MEAEQTNRAQTPTTDALRPFSRPGRYRNPEVVQQIHALLAAPDFLFWRRARQRDPNHADYVKEEALVYVLREKARCGQHDLAWQIVELLIERCARRIHNAVVRWNLWPQHIEDCVGDVQTQLLNGWMDAGSGNEFWEANFTWCLKCLVQNAVQKYRRIAEEELLPEPLQDDEGHTTDALSRLPDTRAVSPQQRVEMAEALALLTQNERLALTLFHLEGWSQQEIAEHLHVTDRTVRNLLGRAEQRLAAHYGMT